MQSSIILPAPGVSIVTGKADAGQRSTAMGRLIAIISLNPFAMRSFLLLLPALFSVPLFSQTTFAPIGATWTYQQGSVSGPDSNLCVIQVVGDTLLGGRNYSVMEYTEGWFICHEFQPLMASNADTTWIWNTHTEQEQVLFRWNAQVGDTWDTPVPNATGLPVQDTIRWVVTGTAQVLVGVELLRQLQVQATALHFTVDPPLNATYTERLGGSAAPFTWATGSCDAETFVNLRCYSDPEITWVNPAVAGCALVPGPGTPFVAAGATWSYNGWHLENHGLWIEVPHVDPITCTGDTMLEGRHCAVIGTGSWNFCNYSTWFINYRNDTVFYFSQVDSSFHVLYVMNTPIGGSWTSRNPFGSFFEEALDITWTVTGTSTLSIDGVVLRQLQVVGNNHLAGMEPGTITDRMGYSGFLTPWDWGMVGGCDGANDWGLRCYSDPEVSWMDPAYNSCTLLGVDGTAHNATFRAWPNPATSNLFLDGLPPGTNTFRIMDTMGRMEASGEVREGPGPRSIDVRRLPPGVYVLQVDGPLSLSLRWVKE
ncbi:MAG: T9SS type A sorting domain-containing protein [Bacteroidetes bacterium]|nr:T9SS type A sorting domain-containing protein [Bacteroidota bacterium]